eukprot:6481891-Amphidinium_carterae.2
MVASAQIEDLPVPLRCVEAHDPLEWKLQDADIPPAHPWVLVPSHLVSTCPLPDLSAQQPQLLSKVHCYYHGISGFCQSREPSVPLTSLDALFFVLHHEL